MVHRFLSREESRGEEEQGRRTEQRELEE